jgi:hypothetical protein
LTPRRVRLAELEAATDQVGDDVAVWAGERCAAAPPSTPASHAVQPHQRARPLVVDLQPGVAQLVTHPGHAVVAVRGFEDVTHQLDQVDLGDWRSVGPAASRARQS